MKFDDLDRKMRVFETANDYCVVPEMFMVARLDGRSFTRLTKEVCDFEAPFDERFRDLMVRTTGSLMTCGFKVLYGYTESDEISLLFDPAEQQFGRKLRKYISTLAGEASAKFSLLLGRIATFDCRLSLLPNTELVVDYFQWRSEDAARNALNSHCYWALRKQGADVKTATKRLLGLSRAQKNELLFQLGVNYNSLPQWQKRGVGLAWKDALIEARNPKTGEAVMASRRQIGTNLELPMKEDYSRLLRALLGEEQNERAA